MGLLARTLPFQGRGNEIDTRTEYKLYKATNAQAAQIKALEQTTNDDHVQEMIQYLASSIKAFGGDNNLIKTFFIQKHIDGKKSNRMYAYVNIAGEIRIYEIVVNIFDEETFWNPKS